VTLSPVPSFAGWLARQRTEPSPALAEADRAALAGLDQPEWWNDTGRADEMREPMLRAAATYFMTARNSAGSPPRCGRPFPPRQRRQPGTASIGRLIFRIAAGAMPAA